MSLPLVISARVIEKLWAPYSFPLTPEKNDIEGIIIYKHFLELYEQGNNFFSESLPIYLPLTRYYNRLVFNNVTFTRLLHRIILKTKFTNSYIKVNVSIENKDWRLCEVFFTLSEYNITLQMFRKVYLCIRIQPSSSRNQFRVHS